MEKKQAWINWSEIKGAWVLRLWIDNEWQFSKSWGVKHEGEDKVYGEPIDFVRDTILCEIAHMQGLGYDVKITV